MNMSIVQILMMRFFKVILFYPLTFFSIQIKILLQDLKLIQNLNLLSDNIINEDSKAITFNYQNQFSDNRFYGY